ncbi:MAG TPA: HAMP domain-containing sensor histidine kinase [Planctomycetota bacterium]|nr:HAMP domain-containing sensor histidine kinase [Planctomycetota bacterium]
MNTLDSVTFDVLQANVELLAENERLDQERRRLLELDQLKTEFLARVSHDLRTPLNSIIGFSDLITGEVGGRMNKKHAEFISAINRNGHALLAMINELLDLSSLESGHVHLRLEQVTLQTLLDDLRAATHPVLENAGVEARWPDAKALDGKTAVVDRRRIVQVLVNLVDNARKFTPRGGTVTIEMDSDQREVRLVVADNGPGIPTSERERIFAPYYQRPSGGMNANVHIHGVGLGLAIVKSIVDRHGGSIGLDSGIGKGCRFKVTVPTLSTAHLHDVGSKSPQPQTQDA